MKALRENYLPELFHSMESCMHGWDVNILTIKQSRTPLPGPTHNTQQNLLELRFVTKHIVAALQGWVQLISGNHNKTLRGVRADIQRRKNHDALKSPEAVTWDITPTYTLRILLGQKTGTWISSQPSTIIRTELGLQEWRDVVFLR